MAASHPQLLTDRHFSRETTSTHGESQEATRREMLFLKPAQEKPQKAIGATGTRPAASWDWLGSNLLEAPDYFP